MWLLFALSFAHGEPCENPEWIANEVEEYIANYMLDEALAALERADTSWGCSDVANPAVLARLYLAQGAVSYFMEEPLQSRLGFMAAYRTAPEVWTSFYGEDARALYDAQAAMPALSDGTIKFLPVPVGYNVYIDGAPLGESSGVQAGLHLVQIEIPDGDMVFAERLTVLESSEVLVATGLRPGPPKTANANDAVMSAAMGEEEFLEMLASATELQRAARSTEAWFEFGLAAKGPGHVQNISFYNEYRQVRGAHRPAVGLRFGVDLLGSTISLRLGAGLVWGRHEWTICADNTLNASSCSDWDSLLFEPKLLIPIDIGADVWLFKNDRVALGLGPNLARQFQPEIRAVWYASPHPFMIGGVTTLRYSVSPHRWSIALRAGGLYVPYRGLVDDSLGQAHVFGDVQAAMLFYF